MAQLRRILTLQQDAATAAGVGVVLDHLVNALDRQQFRPRARMALLPTPLGATAFAVSTRRVARRASSQRYPGLNWGLLKKRTSGWIRILSTSRA
jgi:hypothetical protein